jgi:hypothetical protein
MSAKANNKQQSRGRCWYCDELGLSSDHIFARSLTKLFEDEFTDREKDKVRHDYIPPEGEPPPPKRAKTFAYTTRKFCRTCNSGWMQMADDAARPTLAAFATNEPLELHPAEQEHLAVWATKTVLGFLSKEPEEYRFAVRDLYHELYRTKKPPVGTQLWLGGNNHGHMGWMGAHSLVFGGPLADQHGFGASLSFGYGVIHLVFHGSTDWRLRLSYRPHQALKSIWPTQPLVAWPPPLLLRPRDLEPLAYEVNDNGRWVANESADQA